MAEETKRAQTPAHRLGRTGLNVWRNVKFVYILKISACGVSVLHHQCMWDGVPCGGTWISPPGGAPAAWRRRSARIDGSTLRALACALWAASRLVCTLDLGALMDDGGAVTLAVVYQ